MLFRSLGRVQAAATSHAPWGHETCSGPASSTIDAMCQRPTPIGGARTTRGARVGGRWGGGGGARRAMRGGMGGELPPTAGARRRAGTFNTPRRHDVPVSRTPKRSRRANGGACRRDARRYARAISRHDGKIGEPNGTGHRRREDARRGHEAQPINKILKSNPHNGHGWRVRRERKKATCACHRPAAASPFAGLRGRG